MTDDLLGKKNSGFTLMELMLSMAITAIIAGLIFGVFRVGLRAWERGERDLERQQRLRSVLELMKKQIASLAPAALLQKAGVFIAFEGNEQRLSMVSRLALDPQHHFGDVFSQYSVGDDKEGATLFLTEKAAPRAGDPLNVEAEAVVNDRQPLVSNLRSLAFQYLKPPDEKTIFDWQPQWDPLVERGLPQAVKIILVEQTEPAPIVVVIPIRNREM